MWYLIYSKYVWYGKKTDNMKNNVNVLIDADPENSEITEPLDFQAALRIRIN
jgi:hypothetical protein